MKRLTFIVLIFQIILLGCSTASNEAYKKDQRKLGERSKAVSALDFPLTRFSEEALGFLEFLHEVVEDFEIVLVNERQLSSFDSIDGISASWCIRTKFLRRDLADENTWVEFGEILRFDHYNGSDYRLIYDEPVLSSPTYLVFGEGLDLAPVLDNLWEKCLG